MSLNKRNQKIRNFFNEKIDSYDQVHEKFMGTKESLADSLNENHKKILDLGPGTGLELIHLFELFKDAHVTAIDITENMLDELSKRNFSNKVELVCGDFFKVDFGKEYDAVISTSALHHFTYKEKLELYKKIFRSLKEGGMFVNADLIALSQADEEECLRTLKEEFDVYKHIDTPLTIEHEIEILKKVGFVDITTEKVDIEDYSLIKAYKK